MQDDKKWICIRVSAAREHLETVAAIMSMIDNALMIEDFSDVEQELDGVYGDLIDEELLKKDRTTAAVSVFVPEEKSPREAQLYVRARLDECGIDAEMTCSGVSEEDWADSWKKYYKPIRTGKRLVIVPVWETYAKQPGEVTVLMDPGMAFGTGTHETTRLCASLLEAYVTPGCRVLDVGCGSGILAICASKLGAGECFACDIDPAAVRIAAENAALNRTDNVTCAVSDLLAGVPQERFDVCVANIVADVIIRMAPDIGRYMKDDGVLIVSGIIEERADEVCAVLAENGFAVVDSRRENGWYAGVVRLAGKA
ncbi:MAG: 50S ribosomal protein L11 methyltransferase [Eubacteriales bacterium]